MATHSSILAWKNPWTEESGGLKSMGLHDWACVHEGGGRWVGSNKLVELKKKKKEIVTATLTFSNYHSGQQPSIPKQDPPPAKELQLAEGSNDN